MLPDAGSRAVCTRAFGGDREGRRFEVRLRLRDLVARSIVRSRTSYPSLPGWYEIAPDDPLHAALL